MAKKKSWLQKYMLEALFVLFLILLVADLIIPDPLPIIDEVILALINGFFGTLLILKRIKK